MKTKCFMFLSQNYPKERINFDLINKDAKECFDEFVLRDETDLDDYILNLIDNIATKFNTIKGYGFWVWKPYLLLKEIESLNEGDILINFDVHLRLDKVKGKFKELVYDKLTPDNYIISGTNGMFEYQYSTHKLVSCMQNYLNYTYPESDIYGFQYESGIVFMLKCEKTIEFLKQWLYIMINYTEYVTNLHDKDSDNYPDFITNRHDQSVFSLLYKYHKMNLYTELNWNIFHNIDNIM